MIEVPEITISNVSTAQASGEKLGELAIGAARATARNAPPCAAVIAATFSNPDRFPSLAVRIAAALSLPTSTPAFDVQMACSAFPYAVYIAGRFAADLDRPVLVVDGDVQSPLVDPADHATGQIFSDAVAACLVTSTPHAEQRATSTFSFLSCHNDALTCPAEGPIRMDGFAVFSFVATEVSRFLRPFGHDFDYFVPHQANPYMVRQLAKTLNLDAKLLTIPDDTKNPGSCSVALALKTAPHAGRALITGFGAGYSAAAGIVRYSPSLC